MKNFWSYIKNDKFAVGCTGQTVYVYDDKGNEIKKFKDITYGYTPMFCPRKNMFVVKSTEGMIAVYSLETMTLTKKFRVAKVGVGSQDDGFCFSGDGEFLYNIERPVSSLYTCLSIYETAGFKRIKQLFLEESAPRLYLIEYDFEKNSLFVLGKMREVGDFVAELQNEKLTDVTKLTFEKYEVLHGFKRLELQGFTAKAKEWSGLNFRGFDLSDAETLTVRLSDYIK